MGEREGGGGEENEEAEDRAAAAEKPPENSSPPPLDLSSKPEPKTAVQLMSTILQMFSDLLLPCHV